MSSITDQVMSQTPLDHLQERPSNLSSADDVQDEDHTPITQLEPEYNQVEIEDPELLALKKELDEEKRRCGTLDLIEEHHRKLEEDTRKMKAIQNEMQSTAKYNPTDADARSIYVGCVDYSVEAHELRSHFGGCGEILRITILYDKITNRPKGFAYIEFVDSSSVERALDLNDSFLKGRALKVNAKRTNIPGISHRRAPRGGYIPRGYMQSRGGYEHRGHERGGPYRGRPREGYHPY